LAVWVFKGAGEAVDELEGVRHGAVFVGFLATFDATGRALRCAVEILAGAKNIGLDLRAGVHSGDVEVRGETVGFPSVEWSHRMNP
jgi:class 3 adenylate cyclase